MYTHTVEPTRWETAVEEQAEVLKGKGAHMDQKEETLGQIPLNYFYGFIADQNLLKSLKATKWDCHNLGNIFIWFYIFVCCFKKFVIASLVILVQILSKRDQIWYSENFFVPHTDPILLMSLSHHSYLEWCTIFAFIFLNYTPYNLCTPIIWSTV